MICLVELALSLRLSVDWPFSVALEGDFRPPWPAAAAAACAAACWARSFLEALPRFFLSLMYSQPSPNSVAVSFTLYL